VKISVAILGIIWAQYFVYICLVIMGRWDLACTCRSSWDFGQLDLFLWGYLRSPTCLHMLDVTE